MTKTNTRRSNRRSTANKTAKPETASSEKKELSPETEALKYHYATVTGGRKFPEGAQVAVKHCFVNKYGDELAIIVHKNNEGVINPKFLKKGKALPEDMVDEFEDERTRMVIAVGVVTQESEKAIAFRLDGTFKPFWVSKSLVNEVHDEDGKAVEGQYEMPYWAVKQKAGQVIADNLEVVEED